MFRPRLRQAVAELNTRPLEFTIQLADFIDNGVASLDRVRTVYDGLEHPRYHVLGNHDFALPRAQVMRELDMTEAYYSFNVGTWRFVVLDTVDLSLSGAWPADVPKHALGTATLATIKADSAPNGYDFNGGLRTYQLDWLRQVLAEACLQDESVVLFAHLPVLEAASSPVHLLWNYEEVLDLIAQRDCVAAYSNGHAHDGGYAKRDGVHHLNFKAMLESPERNAFAVVHVYERALKIEGFGAQPSQILYLRH